MKKKELKKNKYGISKKWFDQFHISKKKGFVILIAVVVSSLLVSMGLFISNIAYKELLLSSSTKASQQAFYVADSVMECALRNDIIGLIFDRAINRSGSKDIEFHCNGKIFKGVNDILSISKTEYNCFYNVASTCYNGRFVYYVSFAESGLDFRTGNVNMPASDIVKDAPYAKVIFEKNNIGDLGNGRPKTKDETIIKVYGHNKYSGLGLVERALETRL